MTYELDRHLAVTALGEGAYAAHLDPGWAVGAGINGGYVLAVVGAAVAAELDERAHPDPLTVSAHYLTPATAGPARVQVRLRRGSGRRSTVSASLLQDVDGDEVERVVVTGVWWRVPEQAARERQPAPVDLPAIEECWAATDAPEQVRRAAPLMERFDTRLDPAYAGWALGRPSGTGVVQGWFALADHRPLDPTSLLMVVDALPPVTFDLGRPGWAPTLELTVHVRGTPAPGWARVRHETRTVGDGCFEEDCWVWDSTGLLVAQSRQLALLPR